MKKRYLYSILFGIPGFFIATVICFGLFGAAAGLLWIFVLGDNPWPAATNTFLPLLFLLVFLAIWSVIISRGYVYGKLREDDRPIDRRHLLLAAVATLLPILALILHQYSVGNLRPKSDSLRCSDYCRDQGYAGSGVPARDSGDRSCICYDPAGREALKVPLDTLHP